MTQDEIFEMAGSAGIIPWTKHEYVGEKRFSASDEGLDGDAVALIQFANLVAAHEREACAKVCDDRHDEWRFGDGEDSDSGPKECAKAIRARRQA
jgi:hypothetical protein